MENMQVTLDEVLALSRNGTKEGAPASYIPELAQTDPGLFSVSATALDGTTRSSGDSDRFFSM
ncbi:MAG: glutaminase, partial [Candidatus Accumulibacter sp.]|nr:glutaminase [Accumulibacter sp.]